MHCLLSTLLIHVLTNFSDVIDLVMFVRGMETHCEECLRVTVGTRSENEQFLKLLRSIAEELNVV